MYAKDFEIWTTPELPDDNLGYPSCISCINPKYHFNYWDMLHSSARQPSFSCDELKMFWINPNGDLDRTTYPASIGCLGFSTTHISGRRTGFNLESWTARWYNNGELNRSSGPYSIQGNRLRVLVDKKGVARAVNEPTITAYEWEHPSDGSLISRGKIDASLLHHDIKIDSLSSTDSVFRDSLDEMAFYSSV